MHSEQPVFINQISLNYKTSGQQLSVSLEQCDENLSIISVI
jgi:hypothetical protein